MFAAASGNNGIPGVSAATAQALQAGKARGNLNLDEIFGDCFFTPDGQTVFLSDLQNGGGHIQSAETVPTTVASKAVAAPPVAATVTTTAPAPTYVPVPPGAGITSTNLDKPGVAASCMGAASGQQPATKTQPQSQVAPRHHMSYVTAGSMLADGKKRRQRPGERKMSDQQKVERRERNREHAKRSRIRKKFLLESLQQSVSLLKEENEKLRDAIKTHLGEEEASELLNSKNLAEQSLIASGANEANKVLDDPDFSFIKAIQTAQQNFVVTDPSLPDNPIVYATQGFLNLTGYTLDQVLGRNCRFLQGPETDPKAVEKIRKSIEDGSDMSVCLLNYRVDGTTFWNQFFIAALRDASGNITNYVGVQCKVSDQYAANVCKKQEEEENEGNEGEEDDDAAADEEPAETTTQG